MKDLFSDFFKMFSGNKNKIKLHQEELKMKKMFDIDGVCKRINRTARMNLSGHDSCAVFSLVDSKRGNFVVALFSEE
jgi:hypothetical protein